VVLGRLPGAIGRNSRRHHCHAQSAQWCGGSIYRLSFIGIGWITSADTINHIFCIRLPNFPALYAAASLATTAASLDATPLLSPTPSPTPSSASMSLAVSPSSSLTPSHRPQLLLRPRHSVWYMPRAPPPPARLTASPGQSTLF
jgi:hypothetical protein